MIKSTVQKKTLFKMAVKTVVLPLRMLFFYILKPNTFSAEKMLVSRTTGGPLGRAILVNKL